MPATIKCNNANKEEIKAYCLSEIGALMESIRENSDAVAVEVLNDGLEITFPIGEIYGYSSDYVQNIPFIFKELKKKYPDIAIHGIAYEYETVSEATFGPLFYCAAEDNDLTVTFEWQECAVCGKIVQTDVCYNSSQHDFEEGNLLCLCSPTCMLEYSLSKEYGEVQPNGSFDETEMDKIYESDDEDKALKKLLWKRIAINEEDYREDFIANMQRIIDLTNKKGVTATKKKALAALLDNLSKGQVKQPNATGADEEIESIDFPSSTFVLIGLDYEQGESIRRGLEQRNATVKDRVSAKVQYILVPDGKFSKNSNYKKAEELLQKGNNIRIIKMSEYKNLLRKYDEALYGVDGADAMEKFVVTIQEDYACLDEYIGQDLSIVLPSKIGTWPVTQIGEKCFQWKKITSVVIPDTITEIPSDAFAYCNELTSVKLPKGIRVIGSSAFDSCGELKEIVFPEGLLEIKKRAFNDCKALKSIALPNTLTLLEDDAFGHCKNLSEVIIPAGVTSITSPFCGCDNLTKITVAPNNPVYDSRENCNAIIETATNKLVMGCKNTIIPPSVAVIGESAFAAFDTITSFVVPEGVTEIENGAFSSCFNLESITLPESVSRIGHYALHFCRSLTKVEIPSNVKEFHVSVFANCESLVELTIHEKLSEIHDLDNAWMYNCRIKKVYGSEKSIAKAIAESRRWEYVKIE